MPAAPEPPPRSTLRPPSVLIPAARVSSVGLGVPPNSKSTTIPTQGTRIRTTSAAHIDDFYLENTHYLGFGWRTTGLADQGCTDYGCFEPAVYVAVDVQTIHKVYLVFGVGFGAGAGGERWQSGADDGGVCLSIYIDIEAIHVPLHFKALYVPIYIYLKVIGLPIDDVCIEAISHPALEAVEPRVLGLTHRVHGEQRGCRDRGPREDDYRDMTSRSKCSDCGGAGRTLSTSASASRLSSRTSPASPSSARVPGAEAASSPQTTSPRQTGAGAETGDTWASSLMPAPRARKVSGGYASLTAASVAASKSKEKEKEKERRDMDEKGSGSVRRAAGRCVAFFLFRFGMGWDGVGTEVKAWSVEREWAWTCVSIAHIFGVGRIYRGLGRISTLPALFAHTSTYIALWAETRADGRIYIHPSPLSSSSSAPSLLLSSFIPLAALNICADDLLLQSTSRSCGHSFYFGFFRNQREGEGSYDECGLQSRRWRAYIYIYGFRNCEECEYGGELDDRRGFIARHDTRKEIVISFPGTHTSSLFRHVPFISPGIPLDMADRLSVDRGFLAAYSIVAQVLLDTVTAELAKYPTYTI
ncbi:hypothetical protein B0H14DRAFT_3572389 [Mycena olivaceomarginata]|nr:hypothetical protein B0H14DRAFT_3572389 [Mycena olivaceomarginata]